MFILGQLTVFVDNTTGAPPATRQGVGGSQAEML